MGSFLPDSFDLAESTIECVNLHTTGQPTRVVTRGFPTLHGRLLEQRAQARAHYDHIRARIILEPRGHIAMFGAILRPETELVASGEADMGVLFMHNGGFSDMCGHGTFGVCRLLVDTHDPSIFPNRTRLRYDAETLSVKINLHTPSGIVYATVPTILGGMKSDPSRRISFLSIPAFAAALDLEVEIPPQHRWPELEERTYITLDVGYGGTWYGVVTAQELGFRNGLQNADLTKIENAFQKLSNSLSTVTSWKNRLSYPEVLELPSELRIMIADREWGSTMGEGLGAETGLLFYSNQQIDRSPTGGCVIVRVALAHARGQRAVHTQWLYHSLVSNACGGQGGFLATGTKEVEIPGGNDISGRGVVVKVEGNAYYTGTATFVVEETDPLQNGFSFAALTTMSQKQLKKDR